METVIALNNGVCIRTPHHFSINQNGDTMVLATKHHISVSDIHRESEVCIWSHTGYNLLYASPHKAGTARTLQALKDHPYCETCGKTVHVRA